MRRTLLLLAAVALLLAMVATPAASAGVDNGGCPPDKSNWILVESAEDGYTAEIAEVLAAGFTIQDLLDALGLATEADAIAYYMQIYDSIDKNNDGKTCVLDFFGLEKKFPSYFNMIDNVLPH